MSGDDQVDDQVEETSEHVSRKLDSLSPTTEMDYEREPRYKNIIHLWEFLLELLAYGDECRSMIAWVREEHGEFKLKNKDEVAKKWGAYKKIKGMNYEKLSRALRHYYPKGIIKKVPGQRLVYKFNKLPYKYEPGVTRSLYHGHRIKACLQQQKRVETTPPQRDTGGLPSAFTPVSTPLRKSWTWPLLPTPSRPMLWCPGPVIHTPSSSDCSKTRIMFPITVDPMTSYALPFGFKQERVSPVFYKATPETKAIPVSVIKRV